jgi:death on curing protein
LGCRRAPRADAAGAAAGRLGTRSPKQRVRGPGGLPRLRPESGLLAARIVKNHPLRDGNKRVAWLALIEFVERNGHRFEEPTSKEAVVTMFALAAGKRSETDFVDWVRRRITPKPS